MCLGIGVSGGWVEEERGRRGGEGGGGRGVTPGQPFV